MLFKCYFCVLIGCQLSSAVGYTAQVLPLTDPVKFIEAILGGYKQDNDSSIVGSNESAYQESNGLRKREGYVYVELSTRKYPGAGIQIGTLQLYYKPPRHVSTRSIKDLGSAVGRNDELFRTCLNYEDEVDFSYMRAHSATKNALQIFSQQMNQILGIYGGDGQIKVFYGRGNENAGYRKEGNIIGELDLGYLNFQYFTKNSGRADDKALLALGRNVLQYYFKQLREGQPQGLGFKIEFRQAKHDQRHKDIGQLHFSFVKSQNLRGTDRKSKRQLDMSDSYKDFLDFDKPIRFPDSLSYDYYYRMGSSDNQSVDKYDIDSDEAYFYIFWEEHPTDYGRLASSDNRREEHTTEYGRLASSDNHRDADKDDSGNIRDDEDEEDHSGSGHLRENQLRSFASAMDKVVMKHNYRTKFHTRFVKSSHNKNRGDRIDLGILKVKHYNPSTGHHRKPKADVVVLKEPNSKWLHDDSWWKNIKPQTMDLPKRKTKKFKN